MTIEIRQLVIRAVVERRPEPPQPAVSAPVRTWGRTAPAASRPDAAPQDDALVAACVREVLRKLDRARER